MNEQNQTPTPAAVPSTLKAALIAAQAKFSTVKKGKWNKFEGFAYSTLADDLDMVRPALAEFGLGYTQDVETNEQSVTVVTTLFHVSGEERVGKPITFPVLKPTPQEFVKAAGWGRKMGVQAMFGIAADAEGEVEGPREASKERGEQKRQERETRRPPAEKQEKTRQAQASTKPAKAWDRLVKHAKAEGLPVNKLAELAKQVTKKTRVYELDDTDFKVVVDAIAEAKKDAAA